jgi:hypothetical protein
MSEFYDENIDMNKDNFEMQFDIFKNKYINFKNSLYILLQKYVNNYHIIMNKEDISNFLNIHIIMNLVLIYHDYFLCRKDSLSISGEHILEKYEYLNNNISSLSKDDKNIYISAYIFITSIHSLMEYDEFIQQILDLSNYYESYCKNETKNMVAMIELEEALGNLNL